MNSPLSISERALAALAPAAVDAPYLAGLNPEQRRAVEATDGPVLVLAGAGTGKTRALTARLAHLLNTRRARPWEILAVTFTNKAAREMKERVGALIGAEIEGLQWLGTFHSIAAKILRRHAELVGLKSTFTIIDADDQARLAAQVIEAAGLDEKRWTGRAFAGLVDSWKNRGLAPHQVPAGEQHRFADGRAIALYTAFQDRLKTLNAADFGDLLLHNVAIFTAHPDILADYQSRFRYLLVDEYQDTNVAQYLWLRLLAQKSRNLCCVGDDDQSIYGWRGAEIENILKFERDFPGAEVIRLERNYRSTAPILAAATGLIAANKGRLGKTLWTDAADGEKVKVRGVWDGEEEARLVGDDIEAGQARGRRLSDFAVLVRASFQMRAFEERFNALGLPYAVVGGPRFYEREESRDAIAYLRLIRSPDDDLAFERIANKPARKLGEQTLQSVRAVARARGVSMFAGCRIVLETDDLGAGPKSAIRKFVEMIDRWAGAAASHSPRDLAELALEESGYVDYWRTNKSPKSESKLDNLKEIVQAVSEYDTLGAYLDHVALVAEHNEASPEGQVWLMTFHAAKGLEFPVVFLPGWEEGVFPSQRSLDEGGTAALEEERRLAYVGITRAKEQCVISFAANRQIYGRWQTAIPSRFIDDLPSAAVDVLSQPGLYGAAAATMPIHSRLDDLVVDADYYENPGWKRARAAASRPAVKPPILEGRAASVASSFGGGSKFAVGERIFHQKFGYGRVKAADGQKLTVDFEHSGEKKIIDTFAQKAGR